MQSSSKKAINSILNYYAKSKSKLAILPVVSTQSEEIKNDYNKFSMVTSFSSDKELEELVLGFKDFADYVAVAFGERDFMNKLEGLKFLNFPEYKKIVYTDTASGKARSKAALTPALCELYGVSYCSNDIFTAALLDNKMASFGLLQSFGYRLPQTWFYFHKTKWISGRPTADKLLIAKPAYECASIGIDEKSVSKYNSEFQKHIQKLSLDFDQPIMVQEFIEGYEVEVPIFDLKEPLCPGAAGISYKGKKYLGKAFLTYDSVLKDDFKFYDFLAYKPKTAEQLIRISRSLYSALQLRGPVRIDFRVSKSGEFYIMDYNNSPHLGSQHSFAFVTRNLGYKYSDMLKLIVYPSLLKK